MNDFTKDELIEMADYCNWDIDNTAHSDFRRNLRVKMEYMIKNYCEHTYDVWALYTFYGSEPVGALCYSCDKLVDYIDNE